MFWFLFRERHFLVHLWEPSNTFWVERTVVLSLALDTWEGGSILQLAEHTAWASACVAGPQALGMAFAVLFSAGTAIWGRPVDLCIVCYAWQYSLVSPGQILANLWILQKKGEYKKIPSMSLSSPRCSSLKAVGNSELDPGAVERSRQTLSWRQDESLSVSLPWWVSPTGLFWSILRKKKIRP